MATSRRRFLTGVSVLALAPAVLAACGADDSSGPGGSGSEGSGDFSPVEFEHKFGTATVEAPPTKVAVVGLMEQDALIALGIAPIATTIWFGEADGRIHSWARPAFDELGAELPTVLDPADGIPVEEVARLQPDLILGIYSGMTQEEYDILSQVAPTIAPTEEFGDYGTPWDEMTRTIARAVGRDDEGEALIEEIDARIAEEAEANAELFAGASVGVVTPFEGLFIYGPQDPRARILEQLGMSFPEVLLEDRPEGDEFGWSVSEERTSDLAGLDGVVWLTLDTASEGQLRLWEGTDTAQEGRFVDIGEADGDYYVGHSMVTPLSIPFVLDRYIPQLVALLDGDPATEPPSGAV